MIKPYRRLLDRSTASTGVIGTIGCPVKRLAALLPERGGCRRKRDHGALTFRIDRGALLRAARLSALVVLPFAALILILGCLPDRRNRWI